jgi:hypothetical protein
MYIHPQTDKHLPKVPLQVNFLDGDNLDCFLRVLSSYAFYLRKAGYYSLIICLCTGTMLMPLLFYLCLVFSEFFSTDYGDVINKIRTNTGANFSLLHLDASLSPVLMKQTTMFVLSADDISGKPIVVKIIFENF